MVGGLGLSPSTDVEREAISEEGAPLATHQHLHGKAVRGAETMTGSAPHQAPHQAPRPAPLDRPARQRGRPAVPPLRWRHDARVGAAGEDEAKKAAARLRLGGAREGGLLVASQLDEGLLERDTHLTAAGESEDGARKQRSALDPLDRPARKRGRPAVPPLWWRHDARLGAAGEDEVKKAAARLRLGGAREGGLLVASQLHEGLLERDTHLLAAQVMAPLGSFRHASPPVVPPTYLRYHRRPTPRRS